jgi:hypothetical protein
VQDPQALYQELPREHELLSVVSEIADIANGREEPALALARKIFARLFEVTTARYGHAVHVKSFVLSCDRQTPTFG